MIHLHHNFGEFYLLALPVNYISFSDHRHAIDYHKNTQKVHSLLFLCLNDRINQVVSDL